MKVINAIVTLCILLTLVVNNCYAQSLSNRNDVTKIRIEKSGQLERLMKNASAQGTKKLRLIAGENVNKAYLNEKDLKYLSTLGQLEELYFDINIDETEHLKYIRKYGKISNRNFPNLKVFGVGKRHDFGDGYKENEYLFDLKVKALNMDVDTYFPKGIVFEDVFLFARPEIRRGSVYGHIDDGIDEWMSRLGDFHQVRNRLKNNHHIHSIHVKELDWLEADRFSNLNPAIIYLNGEKYLANYNSLLYPEDRDLSQYAGILPMALTNTVFETLKLPDDQKVVSEYLFYDVSANRIDLNKVTIIEEKAFINTKVKELLIPGTVKSIDGGAFREATIETIYMQGQYAPSIDGSCYFKELQFIIPKGSRRNYNLGDWKNVRTLEDGSKNEYAFTIDMPGILSAYLTEEIRSSVVSLKLRGILDGDDIELVKKCLNLRKLDLGETYILESQKGATTKQSDYDALYKRFMDMLNEGDIQSDATCRCPGLSGTQIEELILPKVLQQWFGKKNEPKIAVKRYRIKKQIYFL